MYSLCSTKWWTFFGDFFSHFISLMRGWGRKFISLSKEGLFSFLSDCQLVVLLTFFHNFCQVVQKFFFSWCFLMMIGESCRTISFVWKLHFFCEKMISFSSREGEKCIFTKKRVYHFFCFVLTIFDLKWRKKLFDYLFFLFETHKPINNLIVVLEDSVSKRYV